jgi:O-antigen/teichoic acid export membrane protein
MAFPLIRILFGPAWDQAAPLASVLAVAALVTTLCAMHPQTYQAAGAMRERLRVQLVIAPVQVATIVTSTQISLTCVTYALMANAIVELIVSQQAINRLLGSTPADIFRSVAPSGLVAVASAIGPTAIAAWSPPQSEWLWMPVLMAAASAAVGWILATIMTRHPLHKEICEAIGALHEWRGAVAGRQGHSETSGATEAQCGVVGHQV